MKNLNENIINEFLKSKSLNEARLTDILTYFWSKRKGDKKRKQAATQSDEMLAQIDANKDDFKRIEVSLVKAGMSGKAGAMTKLGNKFRELAKQQKLIDEQMSALKQEIPEQIEALFEAGDLAYTMVVETAGGIFTKSKETERATLDNKVFKLLLEQAGVATDIIEKCIQGATKVSKVASTVKFELHQSKASNFFSKLGEKIKDWWGSMTSFIKSGFDELEKLNKEILSEMQD